MDLFLNLLLGIATYFGLYTTIYFLLILIQNKDKVNNPIPKRIPGVTVIIPAYNEENTIIKTVQSVIGLDYPKNKLKIIVVDDGSTDKTAEVVDNYLKDIKTKVKIKLIRKENGGKASAVNVGIKNSKTEFIATLDADSFVDKNALKNMIGYFNDKDVMAVTPSLKVYKPKTILQKIQFTEYLFGIFLRKVFSFVNSIHVTPGPFSIYRVKFFNKHGYFDEGNITEDIEIALRIQSNNYKIENSIDGNVYTVAPRTFKPLLRQRIRWYKGLLDNLLRYKHMFSPKYGELGMFFLPAALVSTFIAMSIPLFLFFKYIVDAKAFLSNLFMINFDILPMLRFRIDPFFINTRFLFVLSMLSLLAFVIIILFTKKFSKEKLSIAIPLVSYALFYWILYGFWWISASITKLIKIRVKW